MADPILKNARMKSTPQRRKIVHILSRSSSPLTAEEIFSLFPDLSTKRAAVFTELAELALDQEKTLKEDQIRQIILKYRNQE